VKRESRSSLGPTYRIKDGRRVRLRPATEEDAEAIIQAVDSVARERAYFLRSRFEQDVVAERAFITKTVEQGNLFLLAELEGNLVGWVTLFRGQQEFRHHTAELGMGVLQASRGLGIGTALLRYAVEWAAHHNVEKVNLGVRASNQRAQALYRKFGFVEEGRRIKEIKDSADEYDDSIEMAAFVEKVA
jgi:RimJ/RimL family protein N-acetyltransferase